MICQKCKEKGLKSKVYDEGGSSTLMHCPTYWDEEGKHHRHDSNVVKQTYRCSNGHRWTRRIRNTCHCGWKQPYTDYFTKDDKRWTGAVIVTIQNEPVGPHGIINGERVPLFVRELTDEELITWHEPQSTNLITTSGGPSFTIINNNYEY